MQLRILRRLTPASTNKQKQALISPSRYRDLLCIAKAYITWLSAASALCGSSESSRSQIMPKTFRSFFPLLCIVHAGQQLVHTSDWAASSRDLTHREHVVAGDAKYCPRRDCNKAMLSLYEAMGSCLHPARSSEPTARERRGPAL